MRNARHGTIARSAIALLLLVSVVGCDDQTSMSPVTSGQVSSTSVARLTVTSDLVTLKTGESVEIALAEASASEGRHLWSSDDASIADVDNAGNNTARKVGSTTITVSEAGKATDILVTVLPSDSTAGIHEADQ